MKKFERLRHIRYFSNSLRNLPKQYSSADTTRLTLVHFCVQSLDILECLPEHADCCGEVEREIYIYNREEIIEWIYGLQTLPTLVKSRESDDGGESSSTTTFAGYVGGGFKGGTYLGPLPNASESGNYVETGEDDDWQSSTVEEEYHPYDHSHLAMTYVAICTLLALGDDLSRIHKTAILQTLKSLQKEDGSFVAISSNCRATSSAALGAESEADDDCDLRFMYLAVTIWYLLTDLTSNSDEDDEDKSEDSTIDTQSATNYILSCITYDGSLGLTPGREGHGGSTFCGTASLYLMGVLDDVMAREDLRGWREDLIRWCVARQHSLPKSNKGEHEENGECNNGYLDWEGHASGMQGRPNKLQDTCYSYWIGGTLHILSESHLLDGWALREYVLTCQSPYGGFGKVVGANPDPLHSFYTLAWLAMSGEQGCCEEDDDYDDRNGYESEIREQVQESIGRLSKLDCALGMCAKRRPVFQKAATMHGNV
eukprot:CAMPEP_0172538250 /NCGR_PEP_ID=MMETSP1067-20121228/9674_1 /TAXON_ID=265564 ORGANISM="Thalassiosira punctigera, Strain Tpunct2005C2" /NCGR_SAMPLE_ID=MMETSP1067 /ASSEMBLY_ACC=CAM_ASM_000444 /LENGTH=483 /DNA_ID=CAMNT_0013323707 /DNA_START=72 /DNA_END=1523 /DNA_ORIENTATION=+